MMLLLMDAAQQDSACGCRVKGAAGIFAAALCCSAADTTGPPHHLLQISLISIIMEYGLMEQTSVPRTSLLRLSAPILHLQAGRSGCRMQLTVRAALRTAAQTAELPGAAAHSRRWPASQ